MTGFFNFIKERGVVGLAIGFIFGTEVSKLVTATVTDLINPLVAVALGRLGGLKEASFAVWGATLMWGNFLAAVINFIIIALVVYLAFKILKLDRFDDKKKK